jgi:hypothetical protein
MKKWPTTKQPSKSPEREQKLNYDAVPHAEAFVRNQGATLRDNKTRKDLENCFNTYWENQSEFTCPATFAEILFAMANVLEVCTVKESTRISWVDRNQLLGIIDALNKKARPKKQKNKPMLDDDGWFTLPASVDPPTPLQRPNSTAPLLASSLPATATLPMTPASPTTDYSGHEGKLPDELPTPQPEPVFSQEPKIGLAEFCGDCFQLKTKKLAENRYCFRCSLHPSSGTHCPECSTAETGVTCKTRHGTLDKKARTTQWAVLRSTQGWPLFDGTLKETKQQSRTVAWMKVDYRQGVDTVYQPICINKYDCKDKTTCTFSHSETVKAIRNYLGFRQLTFDQAVSKAGKEKPELKTDGDWSSFVYFTR